MVEVGIELMTSYGDSLAHCRSIKYKRPTLLCWEKPEKGALKLNIDATFKDGRGGYGGILRNDQGELVVAMGLEGKCETPLDAEIQALLICLQECIGRGYKKMAIEIDSLQLVLMIQGKITHWKAQSKISRIATIIASSSSTLTHTYRERNMAADWIAKHSWKKRQHFLWKADTGHKGMTKLIQLEISGLPQIRLG
ncbi:hypothetical protein LIER_24117 [Lithospermum erythrorhizon]|uniref:RNase H type-1 domain-containing protein n=1 Tax=Lithospermum erythrorhizon TaxID=34254 RepID=A0AAV3R1D6_LITER